MRLTQFKHSHIINSILAGLFCLLAINATFSQEKRTGFPLPEDLWVDSVMHSLTLDEMIGQLLVVRANKPMERYFPEVADYIRKYHIGGVTFFGGYPLQEVVQTNGWQSMSDIPLLISIDAEWGLGMRLKGAMSFPYQMTLGAIQDDSLVYLMGRAIGRQCRRMGIQMNFAPVVDINSNPANPVIHMRSFGEDRDNVARKGTAYMKGLIDEGIIPVAKHFPGHGDTGTDSHLDLPVIEHDIARLDSVELYPFRELIRNGLPAIMIAHLYVPSLESWSNRAATLSVNVVTGLLREQMGFKGLVVTDALDMRGVTKYDRPGVIEVKAITAGNDILLLSEDIPRAVSGIKEAIRRHEIREETIRDRCEKVLRYKYRAGLSKKPVVAIENLYEDLDNPEDQALNRKLFESAVTIVRNDSDLLPLKRLDTLNIATVSIGFGKQTPFQERLSYYAPMKHFSLGADLTNEEIRSLLDSLRPFNMVVASIQNTSFRTEEDFGISPNTIRLITSLAGSKTLVLDLFASPYALALFSGLPGKAAIVVSYQDHPVMQDVSAQAIFGGVAAIGRLPVKGSDEFPLGTGFTTEQTRLKYTIPEALSIDSRDLKNIDSIVNDAIAKEAFPGCQVMAIKDGQVFFQKSYGYHTYDDKLPVNDFDLYDLASLTKIIATTPSIMKLSDEGLFNIDQKLSFYLPYLRGKDKGHIVIRELMAHQARLWPWIAYYLATITEDKLDTAIYSSYQSIEFPTRVAEGIYIRKGYQEVMYDTIIRSKMVPTSMYKYSDLGFYFLKDIIDSITGEPINVYAYENFYKPLGLTTTGYLPRERFPLARIVPTENDRVFRHQLLQGDVHDPGAAMLGGVGGHAGLFSDANDLGIFMQMLLNKGKYGGATYFEPSTVDEFTRRQFPLNDNRRGIGFDKPLPVYDRMGPTCESASQKSFGHSGFTGTLCWADPANGLVYIFLSNRVYPDASNNKLSEWDIRPKIQEVFYQAIKKNQTFTPQKTK